MPGLAMVRLRRAGLERRTGRLDQAEALLREAVQQSKDSPSLHAFYSVKLARLLLKLCKNAAKAKAVLLEAIELSPVSRASERQGWRAGGLEGWRAGGREDGRTGGLEDVRAGGWEGERTGGREGWRAGGREDGRARGLED